MSSSETSTSLAPSVERCGATELPDRLGSQVGLLLEDGLGQEHLCAFAARLRERRSSFELD
jgi:hypothetical protein